MKSSLLLALLSLAMPSEVVVGEGESLAQVARRTLGDERGASELKALNGLKDEAVAPGTKLKLPGPARERAELSLSAARNAVAQAEAQADQRGQAVARLKEAEAHFQSARYDEAAQKADESWKLLAPKPTRLTVVVDEQKGTTTVLARSGQAKVEAQGVTQSLNAGETVRVERGAPPPPPRPKLGVPQPTQPAHKLKLVLGPTSGGLGPVTLSWKAVEGAERYEVELVPAQGERRVLSANTPQLQVPLAAGSYRWSVRALIQDLRSEASPERGFEVQERLLPLEVRGSSNWK
jgi:hypothetical protein